MVLSILLKILAVTGTILLWILALILVLLLLVLFAPIGYDGAFEKKEEQPWKAGGSVRFLFRAVRCTFRYDGSAEPATDFEIRIFGLPVRKLLARLRDRKQKVKSASSSGERISSSKRQRKRPTVAPGQKERESAADVSGQERTGTDESRPVEVPAKENAAAKAAGAETSAAKEGGQSVRTETSAAKEGGQSVRAETSGQTVEIVKARRPSLIVRLSAAVVSFLAGVRKKFSAMQRAAEQAAGWLDYLASDAFVRFRNFAMRQILAIARHLLPRRLKGRLHYGFEDPSLTGRILAGICAVYPVLPGKLTIDPDFERTVLEGEMSFGGHIIPAVILYRSLRIVLHKEFRVLLRRLRGQNEGTKTKKKDGQLSGGIAVN